MTERDTDVLVSIERMQWTGFAMERFTLGGRRESMARKKFNQEIATTHHAIAEAANRRGCKLDFGEIDLRVAVLAALRKPCCYCVDLFGLDRFAIVLDVPAEREYACHVMANVVACCRLCGEGKGELTGAEWLDVIAALRAADTLAGLATRKALAAGRAAVDRRRGGEGTPRAGAPAGNARSARKA